jgi:hypothetical protein
MSILDNFARIRAFGKRALEFEWLADNEAVPSVRLRYRTIARHYYELAEREEQADKARVAECLERLRLQRGCRSKSNLASEKRSVLPYSG